MAKMKPPRIGQIFSDSSSDESDRVIIAKPRRVKTSASESDGKPSRRSTLTSIEDKPRERISLKVPILESPKDVDIPEGYIDYDMTKLSSVAFNTTIGYQKNTGKVIINKYFKNYDHVGGIITMGFYKHDKKNYSEKLRNIDHVFVKSITGGVDPLKDTIEIPPDQWSAIKRDMVVSYEKKSPPEWIYRTKFNTFTKAKDGTERMSFTSERGFNYIANPLNIKTIRRHITHADKLTTYILEQLNKLERRIQELEKKKSKSSKK